MVAEAVETKPFGPLARRGERFTLRVAIQGVIAEVEAPQRPFSRVLSRSLEAYEPADPGRKSDIRIEVLPTDLPDRWEVKHGDNPYTAKLDVDGVAQRVDWLIVTEAVARLTRFIHVHAAAVATADQTVLLIGQSGRGKSTTSVALAHAGLDLFTDDVALIERDTLRPVTVARPIKLDARSRRMLRAKGLQIPRGYRFGESVVRTVLPGFPPLDVAGPPVRMAIFFADAVRGTRPVTRPLSSAEAVMRLIRQSATELLDRRGPTEGAVTLINAVRSYELTAGRLGDTVEAILALMATVPSTTKANGSAPGKPIPPERER